MDRERIVIEGTRDILAEIGEGVFFNPIQHIDGYTRDEMLRRVREAIADGIRKALTQAGC